MWVQVHWCGWGVGLSVVAGVLTAGGCAAERGPGPVVVNAAETVEPGGAAGMRDEAAVAADVVYRPPAWEKVFAVELTRPRAERTRWRRTAVAQDGVWIITEAQVNKAGGWDEVRRTELVRGDDGAIWLVRVTNVSDGTVTEFTPAVALMPARLDGAVESRGTARVLTYEKGTAGEVEHEGTYTHVVEPWRWKESGVGAGTHARLVMKLGMATVTREVWTGTDPTGGAETTGRGIVRETQAETVVVGPLTIRQRRAELRWAAP